MKIHVTWEHITHGLHTRVQHCPVALAIKQATGRKHVAAGLDYFLVWDLLGKRVYKHDLYDWMLAFDLEELGYARKVKPFIFELPVRRTFRKWLSDFSQRRVACPPRVAPSTASELQEKKEVPCQN